MGVSFAIKAGCWAIAGRALAGQSPGCGPEKKVPAEQVPVGVDAEAEPAVHEERGEAGCGAGQGIDHGA